MAQIDVSELLADPDFVDPIQLVHRIPQVNSLGENKLTDSVVPTVGSVQPVSGKTLQRLPEALRLQNISSFWIRGEIPTTAAGKYASVIVFKGRRYNIQHVFDWTNWGAGWSEGVCIAEPPA